MSELRVSDHIRRIRWPQRSDDPVMDPLDAWSDADRIHVHGLAGDEVRHHRYTGTVLIRCNQTITTVIDVSGDPDAHHADLDYLRRETA